MKEDISKNTLLVLVVLTIIVSLLGTWTVISETVKVKADTPAPVAGESSTVGKVSLDIVPQQSVGATGNVALTIVNT